MNILQPVDIKTKCVDNLLKTPAVVYVWLLYQNP